MNKLITIFTPTYNRCKDLKRLYESLIKQTNKDFYWLIIDDGSSDATKSEVEKWISCGKIEIRYFYQQNKGKSAAHNYGVEKTDTELFVCVDSDDYLSENAIDRIATIWKSHKANEIGILALRSVTKTDNVKTIYKSISLRDAYRKMKIRGDTMLIYNTSIIKKFKFPIFENEKFVPESYLYDLLDKEGDLIYLNEVLYYGEYRSDGYTKNMNKVIKDNPKGYNAFICQRISFDKNILDIFTDTIRMIAIQLVMKKKNIIPESQHQLITFCAFPFGLVLYYLKYYR